MSESNKTESATETESVTETESETESESVAVAPLAAAPTRPNRQIIATLVTMVLGGAMVFMFSRAVADGARRHEDAPIAALVGAENYARIAQGEQTKLHYVGNTLGAPDFSFTTQDGSTFRLSEHRGKVVVLNFWSVTCEPCLREMPSLEKLARIAKGWGDVEVVALSTDAGFDDVRTLIGRETPLTIGFDPEKEIVEGMFGTRMLPETWIIDKRGVIRLRVDGERDWSSAVVIDVVERFR